MEEAYIDSFDQGICVYVCITLCSTIYVTDDSVVLISITSRCISKRKYNNRKVMRSLLVHGRLIL